MARRGPTLIENAAKLMGMPWGRCNWSMSLGRSGRQDRQGDRAAMGDAYPDGAVDQVLFKLAIRGRMGARRMRASTTMTTRASVRAIFGWPEPNGLNPTHSPN